MYHYAGILIVCMHYHRKDARIKYRQKLLGRRTPNALVEMTGNPARSAIKLPERRDARGHGCRLLVLCLRWLWIELLQASFGS